MKYIVRYTTQSKYLGFKREHQKEFKTSNEVFEFIYFNDIKDIEVYEKVYYTIGKEGDKIER